LNPLAIIWYRIEYNIVIFKGYYGCANGKGKQIAKAQLDKIDFRSMTCREALVHVAKMYILLKLPLTKLQASPKS
jgi:hypothetical protein